MKLAELVVPESTVVLTQECQKGVIGELSLLPALAESAKTIGLVENVNRLVTTGRAAGCGVLHCIAATRDDRRGASTNAPLFQGTRSKGVDGPTGPGPTPPGPMTPGGPGTELMDGIEAADSDLVSTRIGGLSPVNGTDVPTLLRNLGAKTIVIVGVSTNVAIPNATLDCVNLGFNVVIPRDAITGYPVDYTDVIIKNTLSLVAKITTTDELTSLWSGSAT
ncbi:MAG TPA: isochorismatase family protein [Acidimicrobiia bacterium]